MILDIRKLSAKWVTKCLRLSADGTCSYIHILPVPLETQQDVLARLVAEDKTWCYINDPESENSKKKSAKAGPRGQSNFAHRNQPSGHGVSFIGQIWYNVGEMYTAEV